MLQNRPLESITFLARFPLKVNSEPASAEGASRKILDVSHHEPKEMHEIAPKTAPNTRRTQNAAKPPTRKHHFFGALPYQSKLRACERRRILNVLHHKPKEMHEIPPKTAQNTRKSQNAAKSPTRKHHFFGVLPYQSKLRTCERRRREQKNFGVLALNILKIPHKKLKRNPSQRNFEWVTTKSKHIQASFGGGYR